MKKSEVLALFDGTTKTAIALGTSKSTVSNWGDELPWKWALLVEKVTNGALTYSLHIPCVNITNLDRGKLNEGVIIPPNKDKELNNENQA